jgi:enoyl-CoA hydratase
MQAALLSAIRAAAADPTVRAVVITGAGPSFSAGGDFDLIRRMQDDLTVRRAVLDRSRSLFGALRDLHVPVVAAVNGPAIGAGCTLALLCDIVVAAKTARFGDPRVAFGLAPGDGAAVLWPVLAGLPAARAHLLTGEQLSADEAHRIGLISRVVSDGEALKAATEIATRLAALPSEALQATKRALNQHLAGAETLVFEFALAAENHSLDTDEHRRAIEEHLRPTAHGSVAEEDQRCDG